MRRADAILSRRRTPLVFNQVARTSYNLKLRKGRISLLSNLKRKSRAAQELSTLNEEEWSRDCNTELSLASSNDSDDEFRPTISSSRKRCNDYCDISLTSYHTAESSRALDNCSVFSRGAINRELRGPSLRILPISEICVYETDSINLEPCDTETTSSTFDQSEEIIGHFEDNVDQHGHNYEQIRRDEGQLHSQDDVLVLTFNKNSITTFSIRTLTNLVRQIEKFVNIHIYRCMGYKSPKGLKLCKMFLVYGIFRNMFLEQLLRKPSLSTNLDIQGFADFLFCLIFLIMAQHRKGSILSETELCMTKRKRRKVMYE